MKDGEGKDFFKKAYMAKSKSKALKVKREEGSKFTKEVRDTPYGKVAWLKGKTLNKESAGLNNEFGKINASARRKTHRMRQISGEAGSRGYRPYRRE